jgi:hypothetical protein
MAGVTGEHWATARLRNVANQQTGPARGLVYFHRQPLEEFNQVGIAPVSVAREPHDLPRLAIDRQRNGTRETPLGIEPDRTRRHRNRIGLAAE